MANVITFNCPSCNTAHTVSVEHAGKSVACKNCHSRMNVPRPQSAPAVGATRSGGSQRTGSTESSRRTASAPATPAKPASSGVTPAQKTASSAAAPAQKTASTAAAPSQKTASSGASPAQKTASSGTTPAKKPSSTSARSLIPGGGAAPKPASNSARSLPTKPPSTTPQSLSAPKPPPPPPRTTSPEIPAAMDLAPLMESAPSLMKSDAPLAGFEEIDTIAAPSERSMAVPDTAPPQPAAMMGAVTPPTPRTAPTAPPPSRPASAPAQPVGSASSFGNNASPEESDVKMNAGDQVLRKSPSGRANDANTQFVRSVKRVAVGASISGAQSKVGHSSVIGAKPIAAHPIMPAKPAAGGSPVPEPGAENQPAPAAPPPKSNKGVLIAVVVVVAILLAVGAAAAAGVFSPPKVNSNVANNTPTKTSNQPVKDGGSAPVVESERDKLVRQLGDGNKPAATLWDLYQRAKNAKLSDTDLRPFAKPAARKLLDTPLANVTNDDFFSLANDLARLGDANDADAVYRFLLKEEPEVRNKKPSELYIKLRKVLGFEKYDSMTLAEKLKKYADAEVPGIEPLRDRVREIDKRGDNDWFKLEDVKLFNGVAAEGEELWNKHQEFLKANPFIAQCQAAFKKFLEEPTGHRGKWMWVDVEPYVLYVQMGEKEEKDAALGRVTILRDALRNAASHFEDVWRKPLALKRQWPVEKSPEDRDAMPIEQLVFNEARWCNMWVNAVQATSWKGGSVNIDPLTMRLGYTCVYDFMDQTGRNLMKEILVQTYSCSFARYRVPNPGALEPDANIPWCNDPFIRYALLFLMVPSVRIQVDVYKAEPMGFNNASLIGMFRVRTNPLNIDQNGAIQTAGQQLFTAREMIEIKRESMISFYLQGKVRKFDVEGMTDERARVLAMRNGSALFGWYTMALMTFLEWYNEGGDKSQVYNYREGLHKFIGMELRGELDKGDTVEAFSKCLNLDEAGWKLLEERFLSWSAESHPDWPPIR